MAQTLTALGAGILADAAAIATEIGGGTTTAEITAVAGLLTLLGSRPSVAIPAIELLSSTNAVQLIPS